MIARRSADSPGLPAREPAARYAVLVPAAGASSRMGTPKQLLPIAGQPLVAHVANAALGSRAWPVVVVLGAHVPEVRSAVVHLPVLLVENPGWSEGLASSLRVGATTASQFSDRLAGVIVLLGDQPGVTSGMLDDLIARAEADREAGQDRVIAACRDGELGPPVLFPRRYLPSLQSLAGEAGARGLLAGLPEAALLRVAVDERVDDIDTPDDYQRYSG